MLVRQVDDRHDLIDVRAIKLLVVDIERGVLDGADGQLKARIN